MSAPVTEWVEEARRMLAAGFKAREIAERVGVSACTVRVHLNINGAGDRYRKKLEKNRSAGGNNVVRRAASPNVHAAPQPAVAKVSLPFVGILAGHVSPAYQMVRA